MKNSTLTELNYSIHSFMSHELMLGGAELLIFAILYSFTKGSLGLYYGSQDYLAKASGVSISTVKRAISNLMSKSYVKKVRHHDRTGYRTTEKAEPSEKSIGQAPPNDAAETLPCPSEILKKSLDLREFLVETDKRPIYEFHSVGKDDSVHMTAEQYKRLAILVGPETLSAYIRRLELLIKNGGYRTFSAYKTIKKWIYEDAAV